MTPFQYLFLFAHWRFPCFDIAKRRGSLSIMWGDHLVMIFCRAFLTCSIGRRANGTSKRKQNKMSQLCGRHTVYFVVLSCISRTSSTCHLLHTLHLLMPLSMWRRYSVARRISCKLNSESKVPFSMDKTAVHYISFPSRGCRIPQNQESI